MEEAASGFNSKSKKTIISLIGVLVLVAAIPIAVYLVQQKQIFKPKAEGGAPVSGPETSFTLASPSLVTVGQEFRVSLFAKSDLDAVNLLVAKLRFPQDMLQVVSIQTNNQYLIKNWVENVSDNQTGAISLVGGVPNPGYQTKYNPGAHFLGDLMAEIVFMAKSPGSPTISFEPDSAIYRNSDNVDILNVRREAHFKIVSSNPTPTFVPLGCNLALKKPVFSSGYWKDNIPEYAVDGIDDNKAWVSDKSTGAWLYVDLGAVYTVNGVGVTWHWDDRFGTSATSKIQVSKDVKSWTGVASATLTKATNNSVKQILSFSPIEARYVRFYGSQWNGGWIDMRAFEVYSNSPACLLNPIPVLRGDVNEDKKITLVDMSALLSKWGVEGIEKGNSDLNGDGVVNTFDYSSMIQILVQHKVIKG